MWAVITLDDIQAAAQRLSGIANHTPVVTSRTFDERVGASVFFKCENFQRGGAFKFRGAYNMISQLSDDQRRRGVVSFSSGNHAQGVALAAKLLAVPAVIVMPRDAPEVKLAATRGYGAEVVLYNRVEQKRDAIAHRLAEERGLALVPPFDHPHIIAGQGTAALELLADVPDLDVLIVPIGGGGLISGCSIAAHALRPGMHVIGVEPEAANDSYLSLQKGERVSTPQSHSIADGLLPTAPGEITFPIMQQHLESIALVSDGEIAEAVRFLALRMKLVVEPSGAAPAAALISGRVANVSGKRIGVIVSGGNVDPYKLAGLLNQ
ncbi:MAG TPA: threo-3-hydroxy-L-aspartate ammonia-lyase [Anaerolineae bacterium]|nr:threo-3-hydroxy-L-aspartate ammonia-lyase [Anaerolineae bacterium]